jgi:hypothetical protein
MAPERESPDSGDEHRTMAYDRSSGAITNDAIGRGRSRSLLFRQCAINLRRTAHPQLPLLLHIREQGTLGQLLGIPVHPSESAAGKTMIKRKSGYRRDRRRNSKRTAGNGRQCTLTHRQPTPLSPGSFLVCGGLHPLLIHFIEDRL